MNLVPFSYTGGPSGFVKQEALKAFQRKDAVIVEARILRANPKASGAEAVAAADKIFTKMQAANRGIKKDWYFYPALPKELT